MFCCALLYVHFEGKRKGLLLFLAYIFLVSRACCVALPRGPMGLSAVCDCGIP